MFGNVDVEELLAHDPNLSGLSLGRNYNPPAPPPAAASSGFDAAAALANVAAVVDAVGAFKKKRKKKKVYRPIRINLSACKYEVLRIVQGKLGWDEVRAFLYQLALNTITCTMSDWAGAAAAVNALRQGMASIGCSGRRLAAVLHAAGSCRPALQFCGAPHLLTTHFCR